MVTRALSQNETNAPEGALTLKLKNVKVTVRNNLHYFKNSRIKNEQRAITLKV